MEKTLNTPISIVSMEDDRNLTSVTWNQRFLENVKSDYKLKHREAVLFVNKAKDRFRIVANFFGLAVLILPPTEPEQRLSLYLKVSQFLRRFAGRESMSAYLTSEIESAKVRVERRAAAAEVAAKNRKKS